MSPARRVLVALAAAVVALQLGVASPASADDGGSGHHGDHRGGHHGQDAGDGEGEDAGDGDGDAPADDGSRDDTSHVFGIDNGTWSDATDARHPQYSFAWALRTADGAGTAARNRSKATTSCTGCRAVAVAVEVVVVSHARGHLEAVNLARSFTDCGHCSSTAISYQFVVASPRQLVLTQQGRLRLQRIAARMRQVALAGGSDRAVRRTEARLAAELQAEVRRSVVTRG